MKKKFIDCPSSNWVKHDWNYLVGRTFWRFWWYCETCLNHVFANINRWDFAVAKCPCTFFNLIDKLINAGHFETAPGSAISLTLQPTLFCESLEISKTRICRKICNRKFVKISDCRELYSSVIGPCAVVGYLATAILAVIVEKSFNRKC